MGGCKQMTPEESSVFFSLVSDPHIADSLASGLEEHARGCNLPKAKCRRCRLCELEIKHQWPDLWLSKWPGATADRADEFTGLEFQIIFGVCSGLTNNEMAKQYEITVPIVMTLTAGIYDKLGNVSCRWE